MKYLIFGLLLMVLIISATSVPVEEKGSKNNAEALQTTDSRVINAYPEENNQAEVCLTPACKYTASKVLENMDQSVDPCNDFYQFSCGNFLKKTKIPADKSSVNSFSITEDLVQEQLRSMIEEPIQPNEPKSFQLTKKLYKSCMNQTLIEAAGFRPMRKILKELGGWPVLEGEKWNEGDFSWIKSIYSLRKIGSPFDYFINFYVDIDVKNSPKRTIYLDQGYLELDREFLIRGLEEEEVQTYYDYMIDIAVKFGADKQRATQELKESLDFEIKLAEISMPNEERRNSTALYNPMTVAELQKKIPSIPWLEYINTLLAPDNSVTKDEIVIVEDPKYFSEFERLINRTPKRVQANYVMWRSVAFSVSYLNEALRKRKLNYDTTVTGTTEEVARWKECIDISAESFYIAYGALYVRKYFNKEAKQNALEMVKDIRSAFVDILKNVNWMDPVTKKNALDKANSMSAYIAYPDELLDDKKLDELYKGLEVDENDYFGSILNLKLFETNSSFKRLRQPFNKTDWINHGKAAIVNAFYSNVENSIQIPAGILQGIFFNAERPKYINYGAIGHVIGHEITHGFDDSGRQYNKDGDLVDWWAPETKTAFLERAQCIISMETTVYLSSN